MSILWRDILDYLFNNEIQSYSNCSQILLINVLFSLSMNGSCTDPFYITLLTRQKIVPNVTHGHLQGGNIEWKEVENTGRERICKRWRQTAHEKKEFFFLSVISVTYFSIWRPYVDQMVHCSWNYKVFSFHSLVSFHQSLTISTFTTAPSSSPSSHTAFLCIPI